MGIIETAASIAAPWATIPLKLFGWAKSAGTWLLDNPVPALLVALAGTGYIAVHEHALFARERAALQAQQKAYVAAQAAALAKVQAANSKAAALSAQFAGVTNHDYEDGVADGKSLLADFVRGKAVASSTGGTAAPAKDHATGVPVQPAPAPTVAFTEAQLKVWDVDYDYGLQCYKWAQGVASMFDGKHWPMQAEAPEPPPSQ